MSPMKNILYVALTWLMFVVAYVLYMAGVIGDCYSEADCGRTNPYLAALEVAKFFFFVALPVLSYQVLRRYTPGMSGKTLRGYVAMAGYILICFFGWPLGVVAVPIAIFLWRSAPKYT